MALEDKFAFGAGLFFVLLLKVMGATEVMSKSDKIKVTSTGNQFVSDV